MGESRPRVGWSRFLRCPVAHRKWGHRQQPAASRGAPATTPSPPPWAWAGRTGCVPWDCPRTGKREGDLCDPTGTGRRWDAPPYPWGPAFLGTESAAPAPRPPPSTLPSLSRPRTLRGGAEPASRFSETGRRASRLGLRVRGCASGTCSDVSDVLRGSSRPAGWGRLPSHCVGVGGGQPLPAGGTCFLERESLLRDRGTQEPPLGLARVTEAKHSKPGPALERVRPAGRWGRPDLLTLGPGT